MVLSQLEYFAINHLYPNHCDVIRLCSEALIDWFYLVNATVIVIVVVIIIIVIKMFSSFLTTKCCCVRVQEKL